MRVRTESRKGKPPAPVRHPSPTLSQPVRGHRHSRTSASRWSKIGLVHRPRQYVCKHRCERNPNLGKQHAPPRQHSPPKSCSLCAATGTVAPPLLDGRKSVPSRAHANIRATTEGGRYPEVLKQPAPSRHRSRLLSQTVRRLAQWHRRSRLSMVENRSRRAPAPICMQRPRGPKS